MVTSTKYRIKSERQRSKQRQVIREDLKRKNVERERLTKAKAAVREAASEAPVKPKQKTDVWKKVLTKGEKLKKVRALKKQEASMAKKLGETAPVSFAEAQAKALAEEEASIARRQRNPGQQKKKLPGWGKFDDSE